MTNDKMFDEIGCPEELKKCKEEIKRHKKHIEKLTFQWCEDIGYLFSKDSKTVKIFTSFNYDGDKLSVGTVTVYPRSVVKKIEVLK